MTGESVEARRRLHRLKEAVRNSGCLVREYASDAALASIAAADLERLVDAAVPRLEHLGPAEKERRAHAAYAAGRSRVFIEPPGGFERLERHVSETSAPLVVTGPAGSGKTTWLAGWLQWRTAPAPRDAERRRNWWRRTVPTTPVAAAWTWSHSVGATPASARWTSLVERFVADVETQTGSSIEIGDDPPRVRAAFGQAVAAVSREGRAVIVLDGVDGFQTSTESMDLAWLPPDLPDQIRLIVTLAPGPALERLKARVGRYTSWPYGPSATANGSW